MPAVVACPHCDRKLKVPDTLLGKRVKCPACQTPFTAAAAKAAQPAPAGKKAPPAARKPHHDDDDGPQQYDVVREQGPEDEEEEGPPKRGLLEEHLRKQIMDERSKRGRRPFSENWRKTRWGVRILALAIFILVVNFLAQTVGRGIIYVVTFPESLEPSPNPNQVAAYEARVKDAEAERTASKRYLDSAVAIVYLVHHLVALAGIGICLLSPDKNAMRLLAAAALVLALAGLGLEVGVSIDPLQYLISGGPVDARGNIPPPHPALKIATEVVGYLRCFVFLFFLRAVAVATKTDELKREVFMLMISMGVAILFWLVMAILAAAQLPALFGSGVGSVAIEGSVLGVLGMGSLALVLAMMVWFTMTLHSTTVAITDWIRER